MMGLWDKVYNWFWALPNAEKISFWGVLIPTLGLIAGFIAWLLSKRNRKESGSSVNITVTSPPKEDSGALAEKIYDRLEKTEGQLNEATQSLQSKDEEIRALKDAVEGLRELEKHDETAQLADEAERELLTGNPAKAKDLFRNIAENKFKKSKETDAQSQAEKIESAHAYRRLGALAFRNDTHNALEAYQKSVELDPDNADGLNKLGRLLRRLGKLNTAEEYYLKALKINDELGHKEGMAKQYCNIGIIREIQGDLKGAEEYHRQSLRIEEELGHKKGMAADYGNIGNIRQIQGDLVGAEDYYLKSLKINEEIERKVGIAIQCSNLGLIRKMQGDLVKAEDYFLKSLKINEDLGRKEGIATNLCNLGTIRKTQGDLVGAEDYYLKSLKINEAMQRKKSIAMDYGNLGNIRQIQGDLVGAEEFYLKSQKINKELGRKEGMAADCCNFANIRKTQGDLVGAEELWSKALALYKEMGAAPMIEDIQCRLDELPTRKICQNFNI
ncbi:tetratricopeptide repeat protein [Maridesulfovibrio frigidus]|uniref:tetratricopeptide repeat protein n=1 Tax=Maridesulfovibrio frigidus TaxID=340956 RepID=UPI00068AAFD3|nr:tetratricopeptide repeat protein [Maridesulfovibrio frigidus]